MTTTLVEQRISATAIERNILQRRLDAAIASAKRAKADEAIALDAFTMFCEGRHLPGETEFVRIDGEAIVVKAPPSTKEPSP